MRTGGSMTFVLFTEHIILLLGKHIVVNFVHVDNSMINAPLF